MEQVIEWIKKRPFLVAAGVVVLLGLLFSLVVFGKFDGIRRDGKRREAALTAQYLDNQNELSSFVLSFKESLGIADRKAEKLEAVLVEAVKGRYEGTAGTPGNNQGTDLINAVVEAYPDLGNLNSYDQILDLIRSGREAYKNKQSKLLDMLREYDTWRDSGILDSQLISLAGFPSDRLEARVGTTVVRGEEARDKMFVIVLVDESKSAYETGEQGPLLDTTETTTTEGNG